MKNMLTMTCFSSPDGHVYLKCKRCKQEFYIVNAAKFTKTICYCPYCGQEANSKRHYNPSDFEDEAED